MTNRIHTLQQCCVESCSYDGETMFQVSFVLGSHMLGYLTVWATMTLVFSCGPGLSQVYMRLIAAMRQILAILGTVD
jgi:hypothetical protein